MTLLLINEFTLKTIFCHSCEGRNPLFGSGFRDSYIRVCVKTKKNKAYCHSCEGRNPLFGSGFRDSCIRVCVKTKRIRHIVIPAKAGILFSAAGLEIPAFAGMTQ
jgi:hypothetical protein